ncbi:MAG: hypothetical protein OIF32_05395, partial [Campylobacterales bacterium]|nr:hypothetical protein [Campylobacterales bacterium]
MSFFVLFGVVFSGFLSVRRYFSISFFISSLFSIGISLSDSSPEDSVLLRSVKKEFLFSTSFFVYY